MMETQPHRVERSSVRLCAYLLSPCMRPPTARPFRTYALYGYTPNEFNPAISTLLMLLQICKNRDMLST